METKQVIVVRRDLKMPKGKIASQVAHASMAAVLPFGSVQRDPLGRPFIHIDPIPEATAVWLEGAFTKVVVGVDSEQELLDIYQRLVLSQQTGEPIPFALIKDNGRTVFGGVPTHTALSVGPAFPNLVDEFTGNLNLL